MQTGKRFIIYDIVTACKKSGSPGDPLLICPVAIYVKYVIFFAIYYSVSYLQIMISHVQEIYCIVPVENSLSISDFFNPKRNESIIPYIKLSKNF